MNDNVDNSSQYVMLEPLNNIKSFGPTPDTFSLYLQTSFNVIMGVIIVMSVFRIIYGGMIFMTSDIVMNKLKGKEAIVGSLKGIFLAVVTWLLLYTINPDILNNKVGRIISDGVVTAGQGLGNVVGGVGVGGIGGAGSGGVAGRGCDNVSSSIEKNKSGQNVCLGQTCSKTCIFDQNTINIAQNEASKAGIDYRIVLSISCRESSGQISAVGNHANNGYPDCGLMQINMQSRGLKSCPSDIMDIRANVQEGIRLYKSKLSSARSYTTVSQTSQAFASYNCCSDGTSPNSASVSCNPDSGYTSPIPKWACPIDPGTSSFNMCNVRNYACDVDACLSKY